MYFQPEDNHETIAKREKLKKKLQVQHELKITFLFNFYAKLRRLKRLGRTVGRAVIPGNFKRRYKIPGRPIGFWRIVLLTHCSNVFILQSTGEVVYRRFFQFRLIFLNQNYQSRSIEYNFNWCWHRKLHLKKKRLPIFKNLLKTSGTTTKVVSCLKIPLTRIACWSFCKLWEPTTSFQVPDLVNSSLPSPPPRLVPRFP